jgi:hypothetical protein
MRTLCNSVSADLCGWDGYGISVSVLSMFRESFRKFSETFRKSLSRARKPAVSMICLAKSYLFTGELRGSTETSTVLI